MGFKDRLSHAWNAFVNMDRGQEAQRTFDYGVSYGGRPDRVRLTTTNERSIITSVLTRMAVDAASIPIKHIKLDEQGRYLEDVNSGLNYCLTEEANIDQAARAFRQDMVMSLFDRGSIAVVPVETSIKPVTAGTFDVKTMRVGEIVAWHPRHVKCAVYNEAVGRREEIILEKKFVSVVENPLYTIMNEPNSILQRLIRKLNLLDAIDEQSGSGKLDLIIQLPYVVKNEARQRQAEKRRADIEFQLKDSKYGVAYTDGTEKITQLNRPVENNLLKQIEFLTEMLYSQLGITKEVMNGTADEATMLNYQNRTIEPIVTAIVESIRRTFLSKTARTQGQSVAYFWDPFKLVPVEKMAEIADKFTRNEILSSNEVRQIVGFKPVRNDPKADELRNSNMPQSELGVAPAAPIDPNNPEGLEPLEVPVNQINPDIPALNNVMASALKGVSDDIDRLTRELS
jgi:Phage portal protein